MKKQIFGLFDTFRGPQDTSTFIEIFAGCCVWVKLMMSNALEQEKYFDFSLKNQLENNFRFIDVLNIYVSNKVNYQRWELSNFQLANIINSLTNLIKTNSISYQDLSETIENTLDSNIGGNFSTRISKELGLLGIDFLEDNIDTVYCPFVSGYKFTHLLPSTSNAYCETPLLVDAYYVNIHNILLDKKINVEVSDPVLMPTFLGDGGLRQFQSSIAMPPFNTKSYNKAEIQDIWGRFPEKSLMDEVYQLRHMLAQTSDRIVCFVTNGFLFRAAAGEKLFKEDVINKNWLKAVISLPNNLLQQTSISLSVVVFDKNKKTQDVLFIDASSEHFIEKSSRAKNKLINASDIMSIFRDPKDSPYSKLCWINEIEAQEYNLSPNRYVVSEKDAILERFLKKHELVKLSDLVEIIRPQAIKHDEKGDCIYIEHNLTSLNSAGQLTGEGKVVKVPTKEASKAEKQRILAGDVLVSCRGGVGRVALIDFPIADNLLASQAFAILRLKPHVTGMSSATLYQYLISEYGQVQLSGLVTGTTAQMLSAKDLSNIDIPIFSLEEIAELDGIRASVLEKHKQLVELQNEIAHLNMSFFK